MIQPHVQLQLDWVPVQAVATLFAPAQFDCMHDRPLCRDKLLILQLHNYHVKQHWTPIIGFRPFLGPRPQP